MKMYKKVLAGLAMTTAFAMSAHATPINVGGVVLDPDYNDANVDKDFISQFSFNQWFGSNTTADNLNYGSAQSISTVFASLNGTNAATGYFLQGAGNFYRVNDIANNIGTGFGAAGSFCPGCQLTYAFGGIGLNKDSTFNLTNAWARMYIDSSTAIAGVTSQTAANNAVDGKVWLDLSFNSLGFKPGSTIEGGTVEANLNIVGGEAADYFDPKSLTYLASTFFSAGGKYATGGNGQAIGNTVPEPGSIALIGLGLLGAAAASRRKKKAA